MSNISNVSELEALAGLVAAKRALRGIVAADAPVHAVLFYGEEGAGKRTLARLLAQYWLCSRPAEEGPCGECKACRTFEKGISPDLLTIRPWGLSNILKLPAIHRTRDAGDEEIPIPVMDFLRTMPIQGRSKVVILENVERMNGDAARALLKTLEDPPEYARFILTTTEISRVEATVRSRCISVPCELPPLPEELELWQAALSNRSPGMLRRIRVNSEIFKEIYELAVAVQTIPLEGAIHFAERIKRISERLQKAEDTNSRSSCATVLRAFGMALRALDADPEAIQRVAIAHRRILGNVNSGLEYDALFANILKH